MLLPAATAELRKQRPVYQSVHLTTPLIGSVLYQRVGSAWSNAPEQVLYAQNINIASNQV